jgi:circadian clock protein KaiB
MAKPQYVVRIYVAGNTGKSSGAIENLKRILDKEMPGQYKIVVVDVSKNPALAREHNLIALPTIIRTLPAPVQKFVGNLSDENGVSVGFDLIADKQGATKAAKIGGQ